jgi:hypothetical protein
MIPQINKSTRRTDYSKPLTGRRLEQFAQHWAKGLSALQAAVAAGYSEKSAERLARCSAVQVRRAYLMGLWGEDVEPDPSTRNGRRMILSQIGQDTSNTAIDRIMPVLVYEKLYGRDEVEAPKTVAKAG